jgi:hypothetical protein
MSRHDVIAASEPAPTPVGLGRSADWGPRPLRRLATRFSSAGRAARADIAMRVELGRDLLDGRVTVAGLKGERADAYLQGIDVIELSGERLLDVLAVRARVAKSSLWRLSPTDRLRRKLPSTPAGRRQAAWLETLVQAGIVERG